MRAIPRACVKPPSRSVISDLSVRHSERAIGTNAWHIDGNKPKTRGFANGAQELKSLAALADGIRLRETYRHTQAEATDKLGKA